MRKLTYPRGRSICKISDIKSVGDQRLLYWTESGKELKPGDIFSVNGDKIIVYTNGENKRVKAMNCISFDALKDADFNLLRIMDIVKDEQAQTRMNQIHNEADWADLVGISNGFGWTYIMFTNNM